MKILHHCSAMTLKYKGFVMQIYACSKSNAQFQRTVSIYAAGSSQLLCVENPNVIAYMLKILKHCKLLSIGRVVLVHRRPTFVKGTSSHVLQILKVSHFMTQLELS